ncbi:MAG: 16S rRNA (guanine(966)-N(2))-methyltransferase RsmD [Bacteroidales bacterium]|nr:16S rRNA (guanine(966)-N(2))-methyltransferase RsmD [Bacteroidales bacterium]
MRIIAGSLKGRRLHVGKSLNVRPTTDFAKESLFNILNNKTDYNNLEVLDLFSGTGSISFEFVSRGVKSVTALEKNFKCVEYIRKNIDLLCLDNIKIVKMNVFEFLGVCKNPFDIIFADPPYDMKNVPEIIDIVFANNLLAKNGFLILEHSAAHNFSSHPNFSETRQYGSVNFSFFKL